LIVPPLIGELACTSQGLRPLLALTRIAISPGIPGAFTILAFGLSGWTFQTPFVSLLIVLVQISSSASANDANARPASRPKRTFMREPPVIRFPA
jgi:hypothetical protein